MRILDYAWNTATSIAQREYDSFRLILDEDLKFPSLSGDDKGVVVKLPVPKAIDEKFYRIQGLYLDQDSAGWDTAWRCFRASIFHLSLHAAYSDFKVYAPWARAKDVGAATFAVALVEDLNIMHKAKAKWPGTVADLAYASYLSALRLSDVDAIGDTPVRVATKLLLGSAGLFRSSGSRLTREEDKAVLGANERARIAVEEGARGKSKAAHLTEAAEAVYSLVTESGGLGEVPCFPFTDAHGPCDLFEGKLLEVDEGKAAALLGSALAHVGLKEDTIPGDPLFVSESRELLAGEETASARVEKMKSFYEGLITPTRLEGLEFPKGDIGTFMRVRSELAGPIKNVRDQLMMVRNVLDEVGGHDAGAQLDTQAVMQVVATQSARTDVFEQLVPTNKDEAWAILIDASQSTSSFAQETKGIATCLAEIAGRMIKQKSQWAMFAFNNSIEVIKDFSEDYGMTSKARIGGLVNRSTTLLPDAIQVAYKALNKRDASVKILVVVSDGYPSGYNDIDKKLVQVIKDVAKTSIFLIGVGVDSAAIKQFFPINCVMSTPYEMMKTFVKSYLELSYMF